MGNVQAPGYYVPCLAALATGIGKEMVVNLSDRLLRVHNDTVAPIFVYAEGEMQATKVEAGGVWSRSAQLQKSLVVLVVCFSDSDSEHAGPGVEAAAIKHKVQAGIVAKVSQLGLACAA
jgi:hypothetical protein